MAKELRILNGRVVIGNTDPDASALLDLQSTTKGLLIPRLNTTQRGAIVSPAHSLMIFNTTSNQFEWYNSNTTTWIAIGGGGGGGTGDVNNGGNAFGSNMSLGTNDNFSLLLESNNIARMQVLNTGQVALLSHNALRFNDLDNSNYIELAGPSSLSGNLIWELPNTAGDEGQFLKKGSGNTWVWADATSLGDVVGPASSTEAGIALYDDATGKVLRNSNVLIDGSDNLTVPGSIATSMNLTVTGSTTLNTGLSGFLKATAGVVSSAATVNLASEVAGVLPIANGGTGQSTAPNAINALLPSQSGQSGKFLSTNGSVSSWQTIPSGTGDINNGGNLFGADISIGTNDAFGLSLITQGASRVVITAAGQIDITSGQSQSLNLSAGNGGTAGGNSTVKAGDGSTTNGNLVLASGNGVGTAGQVQLKIGASVLAALKSNGLELAHAAPLKFLNTGATQSVALTAPSALAASYALIFPDDGGLEGDFLVKGSGDALAWTNPEDLFLSPEGNAIGDIILVGSTDAFGMELITNGTTRVTLTDAGAVSVDAGMDEDVSMTVLGDGEIHLTQDDYDMHLRSDAVELHHSSGVSERKIMAAVSTADDTATTLLDIPMVDGGQMLLDVKVVGKRIGGTAGTNGDGAIYHLRARAKRLSGTVTIHDLYSDESADQPAWNATLVVSSTNVRVEVTGADDNNVNWQVVATVTEA